MLTHRDFLESVADRAGLDRPDAAKRPTASVLVCVARRLDDQAREVLASALPTLDVELARRISEIIDG